MDALKEYTNIQIPEDLNESVRSMLAWIIPEFDPDKDYDESFYKRADEYLHNNPSYITADDIRYDNLRDAVNAIIDYSGKGIKRRVSQDELRELDKDPSKYMATHCGVAY